MDSSKYLYGLPTDHPWMKVLWIDIDEPKFSRTRRNLGTRLKIKIYSIVNNQAGLAKC